jgi:hypothetical protein
MVLFLPQIIKLKPAPANTFEVAKPMPLVAPVMNAIFDNY